MTTDFLKVGILGPTLRFALANHGPHPNSYGLVTSETQKACSKSGCTLVLWDRSSLFCSCRPETMLALQAFFLPLSLQLT